MMTGADLPREAAGETVVLDHSFLLRYLFAVCSLSERWGLSSRVAECLADELASANLRKQV